MSDLQKILSADRPITLAGAPAGFMPWLAADLARAAKGRAVFIAPDDAVFSKNMNNMEQVKARKGPLIAITSGNGADKLKNITDDIVTVPSSLDFISPILSVIPLQLLAYHLAVELGRDVDKPRNLAKSVTVE